MQEAPAPEAQTTIPRLVQAAAVRFGEASALEDGDVRLSFAALEQAASAAARAFGAAGLMPGDRAAIWAPNLAEWILAALGLQAAGGVLVTLNTRFKGAEAGYVLRTSGARMLFTLSEFLGTNYVEAIAGEDLPDLERIVVLRGEAEGATPWSAFLAEGESFDEDEAERRSDSIEPDDLSDLLFTSGTTGSPKGVMTTHGQNLRAFAAWSEVVGLRESDRYLVVNPFFHSFGYKAGWLASFMRGATVLPQLVFDVPEVLERIGRDRVSVLPGPPTLYQSILAHPDRASYDLSSLRLAVTGAAAIPVELIHRMREELGFETIITGYGLTESCGVVSMCRYDDDPETIATTSGRAIPDVDVRCVDAEGKEVPRGEPGEVVVRGYNVMGGYFDDEAETRKAIDEDGWLHTGDVAVMDERGYLRITDRIKDMYIVGGFNCYPAEIENLMYGSGQFAQVAVIGVPDERMGEVGMAFVVPAPGQEVTPESVIAWCRENMANYKVPRSVEVLQELPTTASGKVMKFALRERASASHGASGTPGRAERSGGGGSVSVPDATTVPFVRTIFHPTDFSADSLDAFAHALAICLIRRGELTILHAGEEYLEADEWQQFPHVHGTLERWGLLAEGSSQASLFNELGIRVNKISTLGTPLEAAMEFLSDEPADLIVIATGGHRGRPHFLHGSNAEQVARAAWVPTLFVPRGCRGFVSLDGDITLRRILVPVADRPDPYAALVYATRTSILAAGGEVEIAVLHVGDEMPDLKLPEADNCTWRTLQRRGNVVDEIVRAAEEEPADLIVMATDGRNGLVELIRGSHTERVVHRAPCPVVGVPAE